MSRVIPGNSGVTRDIIPEKKVMLLFRTIRTYTGTCDLPDTRQIRPKVYREIDSPSIRVFVSNVPYPVSVCL